MGSTKRKSAKLEPKATHISNSKAFANATGVINAEKPTTKSTLKMLLPTMLPIAISALPLRAAVTEVKSSGKEVPSATMVKPMKRSLNPA